MKRAFLKDLIKKDVEGVTANVTRQGGLYHYDYQDEPMIRKLKKVYTKKEKGVLWLYWTWEPAPHRNGYPDCGYSGIADSERHRINEAYIFIED